MSPAILVAVYFRHGCLRVMMHCIDSICCSHGHVCFIAELTRDVDHLEECVARMEKDIEHLKFQNQLAANEAKVVSDKRSNTAVARIVILACEKALDPLWKLPVVLHIRYSVFARGYPSWEFPPAPFLPSLKNV